jgi:hypothetical protein
MNHIKLHFSQTLAKFVQDRVTDCVEFSNVYEKCGLAKRGYVGYQDD